jgi:hypothetical protein
MPVQQGKKYKSKTLVFGPTVGKQGTDLASLRKQIEAALQIKFTGYVLRIPCSA